MRIVRALTLTLLVALPLASQQPTVVRQPTAAPLSARLNYSGSGYISFESNRPAYVALFDVTHSGLRQLYPESRYQAELATTFRYVDTPIAHGGSGFRSPLFWNAMYGWSGYGFGNYLASPQWHTLLLVASTSPLTMGYAMANELKLSNALYRQGLGFRMDTDEGFSAIVSQLSPTEADAEVTMDWIDVPPTMYPGYNGFNAGGFCFPAFGFLTGFNTYYTSAAYCGYQRYLNSLRGLVASGPVTTAKPVSPVDTAATVGGGDKTNRTRNGGGAQSSEEIRRIVQQLRDAEGGGRSATYKLGGATTATRGGYRDDVAGSSVGGFRARANGGNGAFGSSDGASTGGATSRGVFTPPPAPVPPAPVVAPTPSRPQVDPPHKP